jgi:hypothetical protein
MDLELGEHYNVTFTDPDAVKYAESFGANGYRISSAGELLPTPRTALGKGGCVHHRLPVGYSENLRLHRRARTTRRDAIAADPILVSHVTWVLSPVSMPRNSAVRVRQPVVDGRDATTA